MEDEFSVARLDKYNAVFFPMSREARLAANFFLVVYVAISRRVIALLVKLHLAPSLWKTKTFFGETFYVKMPAGFMVWRYGFVEGFEFSLAKFMLANVKPGDVFVDAGANDGYFSLLGSKLAGDSGRVYAFEPTPATIPLLNMNFKGKANITLVQQALWEKSGTIDFLDFGLHASGINTSVSHDEILNARPELKDTPVNHLTVPAITLDEFCAKQNIKPSFLQFDAEGGEFEMLKGCENVLKNNKPIVCVEVWSATKKGKYQAMKDFMERFGYSVYWLTKDGGLATEEEPGSETAIFMPRAVA